MTEAKAAVLTGPGRGAIAVVAVWGRDALLVADRVFSPHRGRPLRFTEPGHPRVGRVGGAKGEEVVAVVLDRSGRRIEIQCHGGDQAVRSLLERLADNGAVVGDSSMAARSMARSRLTAEAWMALAEAPTEPAAAILLDQAHGALADAIGRIAADIRPSPHDALRSLDELIRRGALGVRLRRGWQIALVGRPNVGKSRLLNALAGHDRAIVSPVPGTTRDVVSLRTALGGWPVELLDTAGRRVSEDRLEAEGIDRGRARQRAADVVVVVLDRSEPLTPEDQLVLSEAPGALVVANKADLPAAWDSSRARALAVSAARGDGVDELVHTLTCRIVPDPPPIGAGVPFEESQLARLCRCRALLAAGRTDIGYRALVALLE